jgi:hypothetical protein
MGRQDTLRRFEAARRQAVIRFLTLAGGCLLAVGLIGLGWTLRPVWQALDRDMHREAASPAATRAVPQPAAVSPPKPVRIWLAAVSNNPIESKEETSDSNNPAQSKGETSHSNSGQTGGQAPSENAAQPGDENPILNVEQSEDAWTPILSGGEKVVLRITPPGDLNAGNAIKIAFIPGTDCEYGSGRVCVSRHRGGQVTLLTVHSGLGGEGEAFRSAVEGTGLDLAFFTSARIRHNMQALAGSPAWIQSGSLGRDDLSLAVVVRIPPVRLEEYFAFPFDEALSAVAEDSPELQAALDSGGPLLIFEICGWQIPGEAMAPEVSPTTASIYLGVIKIQ